MTSQQIRIGIVGGGIGGLTLALALWRRGLAADVYEQASELREIGAAVALSANATRELERLGCLDAIAALSAEPSELIWRGWRDDRRVASFPVAKGGAYRARFGAPYFGIHRADLQRVLGGAHGPDRLHLGHRLVGIAEKKTVVKLDFANGHSAEVDILIGADGVRSQVRRFIAGEERAAYSSRAHFAASFLFAIYRRCRTRKRCSSGWDRMRICCTTRSAPRARTSIFSPWLKGPGAGRMRIGLRQPRQAKPPLPLQAGIRPSSRWCAPFHTACGGACSPCGRFEGGGAAAPCS